MKTRLCVLLTLLVVAATTLKAWSGNDSPKGEKQPMIYTFALKSIDGKEVNLSQYRGKALLLVNVASQCGYTPQYEGLQKIYSKYKDRGLVVLGFPANNFGAQEPGSRSGDQDVLFHPLQRDVSDVFQNFREGTRPASPVPVPHRVPRPIRSFLAKSNGTSTSSSSTSRATLRLGLTQKRHPKVKPVVGAIEKALN
jgi:hypothetical protein